MEKRKAQEQSAERKVRRSLGSTAWGVEEKPKAWSVQRASDAHGSRRRERSCMSDAAGHGSDKVRTENCASDSKLEGHW